MRLFIFQKSNNYNRQGAKFRSVRDEVGHGKNSLQKILFGIGLMKKKSFTVASVITPGGKFDVLPKGSAKNFFFVLGGLVAAVQNGEA